MKNKIWTFVQKAAKAIAGAVGAAATYLMGVWGTQATIGEAFSAMTGTQWLGLIIAVLGVGGGVYGISNKRK